MQAAKQAKRFVPRVGCLVKVLRAWKTYPELYGTTARVAAVDMAKRTCTVVSINGKYKSTSFLVRFKVTPFPVLTCILDIMYWRGEHGSEYDAI